jgi:hypothetical protein
VDVKVREVVILLDRQEHLEQLVVGLPVEVFMMTGTEGAASGDLVQQTTDGN